MNLNKTSISLTKGKALNLTKEVEGLSSVIVGLGWDVAKVQTKKLFGLVSSSTPNIDCDASAFLLDNSGKAVDTVYFGNLRSKCSSVIHTGDNLTGDGDGDDEQLIVNLHNVPSNISEIVFVVNIYNAKTRNQDFGMIENAFIRIVDRANNKQIAHFNLTDNYAGDTAMIFGSLKRINNQWEFVATGVGTTDDSISQLRRRYL